MAIITYEAPSEQQQRSPIRLRAAIDSLLEWPIKHLRVAGLEHLEELQGERAIIASSHQTGLDIPLAIKTLGGHLDLIVTDQSTHRQSNREISGWVGMKLAGEDNFIPISYEWDEDKKVPAMFKPADAVPVVQALERGKNVLIAAYNPVDENNPTAPRPGYSAALVSLMTGNPVVPLGIRMTDKDRFGRANAEVIVGEPLHLKADPIVNELQDVLGKRQRGESLEADDVKRLKAATTLLRERGALIFEKVRELEGRALDISDEYLLESVGPRLARQALTAETLMRQEHNNSRYISSRFNHYN